MKRMPHAHDHAPDAYDDLLADVKATSHPGNPESR
jgi:hypothetical protein